jgi:hypothetical protein
VAGQSKLAAKEHRNRVVAVQIQRKQLVARGCGWNFIIDIIIDPVKSFIPPTFHKPMHNLLGMSSGLLYARAAYRGSHVTLHI